MGCAGFSSFLPPVSSAAKKTAAQRSPEQPGPNQASGNIEEPDWEAPKKANVQILL